MRREIFRKLLFVALLISAVFAVWSWFRPYEWHPDSAAGCTVEETLLTPDHSFYWVNVHVKLLPGTSHDLKKPVYLKTAAGTSFAPSDTTFGGPEGEEPNEIWLKFWLERKDLAGPLILRINDGHLTVKSTAVPPDLGKDAYRNFTTHRW